MRYEDWDILLFERDCKTPLREFKVSCHVLPDTGTRLFARIALDVLLIDSYS